MKRHALNRATCTLAATVLLLAPFSAPVMADDDLESTITVAYALKKAKAPNDIERSNARDAKRITRQTVANLDDDAESALGQGLGRWLTESRTSKGDD